MKIINGTGLLAALALISCSQNREATFDDPIACESIFEAYTGPSKGWCTGLGAISLDDQRVYFPTYGAANSLHIYDFYWLEENADLLGHGAIHRVVLRFKIYEGDGFLEALEIFSIVEVGERSD